MAGVKRKPKNTKTKKQREEKYKTATHKYINRIVRWKTKGIGKVLTSSQNYHMYCV